MNKPYYMRLTVRSERLYTQLIVSAVPAPQVQCTIPLHVATLLPQEQYIGTYVLTLSRINRVHLLNVLSELRSSVFHHRNTPVYM
jgi:hypothetical protein